MTTLKELIEIAKDLHPYAYLAGGFYKDIRKGKEPKDIDVFMYDRVGYDIVKSILESIEKTEAIKNKVSLTIGRFELIKPVTIANRDLYGKPNDLVPTFDINIARVYIDKDGINFADDEDEIESDIDYNFFRVSYFHKDVQRSQDRADRYETYGYRCIEIRREEHISKKKTKCNMSGGYND